MSQYISSFLIDPVVRQARRLSRTSPSTRQETGHDLATTPPAVADRATSFLAFRTPSFSFPNFLGNQEAVSSTSLPDFTREAHDFPSNDGSLQLVETENLEPAIQARRYVVRAAAHLTSDIQIREHQPLDEDYPLSSSCGDDDMAIPDRHGFGGPQAAPSLSTEGTHPVNQYDCVKKALPEDDGMSQIRRRILAIQRTGTSSEMKARLIYDLMTENHRASQHQNDARAQSPASLQSSGRPYTPSSPKSIDSLRPTNSPPTSSSSYEDFLNPFNLIPEDLKPTYWEKPLNFQADNGPDRTSLDSADEEKALGCAHYKRNIKLQCFSCRRWYSCRFCHDAIEDHLLNRRATRRMLCMLCGCAQPAGQICVLCGYSAAYYYCDVCKLWDDDTHKSIYHCPDCGICRLGEGLGKSHLHCKV